MTPLAPWEIDAGKAKSSGTRSPTRTLRPSGRVTYYDRSQPRREAPQSVDAAWSERWIAPGAAPNMDPKAAIQQWGDQYVRGGSLPSPYLNNTYTSSGGRSGGGGGGGGGGLTPEQQAALARFMGKGPAKYELPEYTPFEMSPRDTAIFEAARNRIKGAAGEDRTRATGLFDALDAQLAGQRNVFENANMTMTPQMSQAYQRIVGGDPGNAMVANVIGGENAYSTNSDGAFANLMAVLASQEGRNMQSRAREAMQARQGVLSGIDAQASGMLGGVEMADLRDARDYNQRRDDYRWQEGRYLDDRALRAMFGNTDNTNDWTRTVLDWLPMVTDPALLAQLGI